MESMNLLDITIKYFSVIVFVMCVLFGMLAFFASWIAWRELHKKKNIIRSIIAAYNITEDTLEKGKTTVGGFELDPAIVQTTFNSLQEILNAIYGEVTGKPMPSRDERTHGRGKPPGVSALGRVFKRKETEERLDIDHAVPTLVPDEREHQHSASHS